MDAATVLNVQAGSAVVQAVAAFFIVFLTAALWMTARNALRTSNKQADAAHMALEAAGKQADAAEKAIEAANKQADAATVSLAETRRDRHFANLPMLKVTFGALTTSIDDTQSVVMTLINAGDAPVLNIHVWLSDCSDLYEPNRTRLAKPTPVPMIARGGNYTVPFDLREFPPGDSPRALSTNWVYINVRFEGLLGARVMQEWYWEPHEWLGQSEPVLGHGEKLVLHRVTGTSGAEPGDLNWQREP